MKKRVTDILLVIMFFVGISVLLYPTVSNYINERHTAKVVESYMRDVQAVAPEDFAKLWKDAEDYNQRLAASPVAFYKPSLIEGYSDALKFNGTSMMGYIKIPKIELVLSISHSVDDVVLKNGVGHMEGTSLPTGGKGNNCVLLGHRGLPSAKLFTDLDKLVEGDIFTLFILDEQLTYEIDKISVESPNNYDPYMRVDGMDYCTLVTCTPYGINTDRLIVRGHRIIPEKVEQIVEETPYYDGVRVIGFSANIIISVVIVLIIFIIVKLRAKRKQNEK